MNRLAAVTAAVLLACAAAHGQQANPAPPDPPAPAAPPPPARPLLYYFEHVILREGAFQHDRDVQAILANSRQATQPLVRLFSKSMLRAAKLIEPDAQAITAEIDSYLRVMKIDRVQRAGYTVHLFQMPPPEHSPEAFFAAIVYKDDEPHLENQPAPSTRYITFELAAGERYALGEWDVRGNHRTLGFGNGVPTIQGFVANVFAVLGIREPPAQPAPETTR